MKKINYQLDIIRQTRKNVLGILEEFSIEELNHIPANFNNNLLWNFGHIIVTQQLLCYSLSGNQPIIDKERITAYRKGSKPEAVLGEEELDFLKEVSDSSLNQFAEDYQKGLFSSYKTYPTSYGIELDSIEDALLFNAVHEAMHLGYCLALKKVIRS